MRRAARTDAPSEAQEQRAVLHWWYAYARTKGIDARLLFSVPNGAHLAGDRTQRAIKMNNLRSQGLTPGVPDLFLAVPRPINAWHGMFIEMKKIGEKPSPVQQDIIELLRNRRYNCIVAQGANEAIRAISVYVESEGPRKAIFPGNA